MIGTPQCACGCGQPVKWRIMHGKPIRPNRWIRGHMNTTHAERVREPEAVKAFLWRRTERSASGCWLWQGPTTKGYATASIGGLRTRTLHRLSYEAYVGPIPEGLDLDHLCRVRNCLNPSHMEPVTRKENVLRGIAVTAENKRKTHCKRGHPFDDKNTARLKTGRRCRTCHNDRCRAYLERKAKSNFEVRGFRPIGFLD